MNYLLSTKLSTISLKKNIAKNPWKTWSEMENGNPDVLEVWCVAAQRKSHFIIIYCRKLVKFLSHIIYSKRTLGPDEQRAMGPKFFWNRNKLFILLWFYMVICLRKFDAYCLTIWSLLGCGCVVKVSKFQNEFMKSSFLPKYKRKVRISALHTTWQKSWQFFVHILGEIMTS